jgi:hypothetical protein
MSSKLLSSFSVSELGRINSYREQRMLTRTVSSHSELGETFSSQSTRNDLDTIQECLKNNLMKRRESTGLNRSCSPKNEPFDKVFSKLDKEISSDKINEKPSCSSTETIGRSKYFHKYALM